MLQPLATLLSQLEQMRSRGVPYVLVTLIGVQGNSTRKLGARMWVAQDGFTLGSVSFGSCGDGEIKKQIQSVLEAGTARRLSFRVGEDEDTELGLACTGDLEVFLEPNPRVEAVWRKALEHLSSRQTVTLETTLEGVPVYSLKTNVGATGGPAREADRRSGPEGAVQTKTPGRWRFVQAVKRPHGRCFDQEDVLKLGQDSQSPLPKRARVESLEYGSYAFLEHWTPPPHLVIIGANPISGPLSRMAREVGCAVTVFDSTPEKVTRELFPDVQNLLSGDLERVLNLEQSDVWTAVVVVSHNYADEVFALRAALVSGAGYLAVLASERRGRALLRFLEDLGFSKNQLERIRTPAGLDLGLDTPAGIALSILSEMTATLNRRTGVPFVQKQLIER